MDAEILFSPIECLVKRSGNGVTGCYFDVVVTCCKLHFCRYFGCPIVFAYKPFTAVYADFSISLQGILFLVGQCAGNGFHLVFYPDAQSEQPTLVQVFFATTGGCENEKK